MTSRILMLNTAMTALIALAVPLQLSAQTYTTFDPANSLLTLPTSINQAGAITGLYVDINILIHGFLRTANGSFTSFDPSGYAYIYPNSINQPGAIAGFYYNYDGSDAYVQHGFLRAADGTLTPFDPPNSQNTYPGTINPAGEIAGYFCDLVGCHGFLRAAKGTFTTIDPPGIVYTFGLPNNDQVPVGINPAGRSREPTLTRAFSSMASCEPRKPERTGRSWNNKASGRQTPMP